MTYHFNRNRNNGMRILVLSLAWLGVSSAQSLNWEGQTGVFVTPLAYTAASPNNNVGKPIVAYHYLDAGDVLGGFHTASVTEGLFGRVEFGYTRTFHQAGDTTGLSPLWDGGFNIVHGKVNVVRENAGKNNWLPAISAGFVARTEDRHVSGVLANRDYNNADFYLVAAKSQLIFGSEFAQQPRQVQNLPGAIVPTTITYAARIVPLPERSKLNVDLGVAQAAGWILPGVNLQARHQFALGIPYGI
jgi:hypothetical protein